MDRYEYKIALELRKKLYFTFIKRKSTRRAFL